MTDRTPAVWISVCSNELVWGDWVITKMLNGWHLVVSSGVSYGPFETLEAVKRHAEDVRGD